jgi:hypothetical protein
MAINASTVEASYKAVRDAVNDGIIATDIDSASSENLVRGTGDLYKKTWYGPTGFYAWDFDDGVNRSKWAWATSLSKIQNQSDNATPVPSTDYAFLVAEDLQDVWGCAKRLWIPTQCIIQLQVTAEVISPTMSELGSTYRLPEYSGNTGSKAYLIVNGDRVESTIGYSFEDSIGPAPSGEASSGLTASSNSPSRYWNRRYYSCFYTFAGDPGTWLDVKFAIDCRNERTYVTRRSIHVQGIHYT